MKKDDQFEDALLRWETRVRQRIQEVIPTDDCISFTRLMDIAQGVVQISQDEKYHIDDCRRCSTFLKKIKKSSVAEQNVKPDLKQTKQAMSTLLTEKKQNQKTRSKVKRIRKRPKSDE